MDYVQMTLDDWMSLKKEIAEEFARASASFVRIGFLLRKAEETEGYKNDGYDSLAEWASAELGLSATYVSRFKAINAKYSVDGYSDRLRTEFVGYGSAKLGEMLSLPDADMEMITPETKRSDIRALKEFNREEPVQKETDSWITELMDVIPAEVKKEIIKEHILQGLDGKKCAEILNPSGNSMKRTGTAMIAMTEEGLTVKIFSPQPERKKISWQEFAEMLEREIGAGAIDELDKEPEEKDQPAAQGAEQEATEEGKGNAEESEELEATEESDGEDDEDESAEEPQEGVPPEATEADVEIIPEPIAPAQKPEEQAALKDIDIKNLLKPEEPAVLKDIRTMLKSLQRAFECREWDRMLQVLEGIEPAVRRAKKEGET